MGDIWCDPRQSNQNCTVFDAAFSMGCCKPVGLWDTYRLRWIWAYSPTGCLGERFSDSLTTHPACNVNKCKYLPLRNIYDNEAPTH